MAEKKNIFDKAKAGPQKDDKKPASKHPAKKSMESVFAEARERAIKSLNGKKK